MLSILIPTYNFDCLPLIRELYDQCEVMFTVDHAFDYEIIIADDCSPRRDLVCALRDAVQSMGVRVKLLELSNNLGRARVRNLLLREACGTWVLLIDSDARTVHHDYVHRYWSVRHCAEVVVGGILHPLNVERSYELRIVYERSFEKERSVAWRNKHPYAHFSVFNLMARKDVISKFCFDTRCDDYGYEDFFLGIALEEQGVKVYHIDNPLLHTGIDTSEVFLSKVEASVSTLSRLPKNLRCKTGLELYASRLRFFHLDAVYIKLLSCMQSVVRNQLLSKKPSILLLQLYKLFLYLKYTKEK